MGSGCRREGRPSAVRGLATAMEHVADLVATCTAQQEDILCVDTLVRKQSRLINDLLDRARRLEQQPAAATPARPSNLMDRVNVLEIDVGMLKDSAQALKRQILRIDQQICAAAASSTATLRESIPKFDGMLIFCNATKTDPIPWWRQFELKSDIHKVRRKPNPTTIKLADDRTHDRYIEAVPVYFAPHACEPVTFDVLDTDFDIILGTPWLASADHMVNSHRQTLTVHDAFGAEVLCTIPLLHPSIRCQVVMTKSFWATCAYERTDEIGLCFLRIVAATESSPTDLSSDPRVVRLLYEFTDIFESPTGVVPDRLISHEIILEAGAVPPKGCIYRMSEEKLAVLCAQLDDLLDKGWIRPSSSPYGAPVLFIRKKNKDLCLCIDYRKLNAQTVTNAGPLPRIDDLLERLGIVEFFSNLDLKLDYHQISIRPQDCYKSACKTRYGHFEWVVLPFGLTNAPTTFQAAMTNELHATLDRFMLVYLDDILVYSRTLEEHLENLRHVLETLRLAKYKANRDKCEFVRQELEYLGHFVTP
ncbi:hypothetical protein CBR_g38965 [Chara braunii]|uniref:Reverse transcriptase domain-containing protein n=1 Tax=Chara braunii TaxID=69332 RepID=A0A388K0S5_CHABU|nr:hypothetical protein CBR_g38965 [Chara braunii]|eukprot:GBG63654.1 hypothetical protein CBR_g38965 [Chara braunii]